MRGFAYVKMWPMVAASILATKAATKWRRMKAATGTASMYARVAAESSRRKT